MTKNLSRLLLLLILSLITNTEAKAQNRIYGKAALHWQTNKVVKNHPAYCLCSTKPAMN